MRTVPSVRRPWPNGYMTRMLLGVAWLPTDCAQSGDRGSPTTTCRLRLPRRVWLTSSGLRSCEHTNEPIFSRRGKKLCSAGMRSSSNVLNVLGSSTKTPMCTEIRRKILGIFAMCLAQPKNSSPPFIGGASDVHRKIPEYLRRVLSHLSDG